MIGMVNDPSFLAYQREGTNLARMERTTRARDTAAGVRSSGVPAAGVPGSGAAATSGPVGTAKRDDALFDACIQFESLFIKQMLNSMRKTVQKSGLMDGGMAEEIFEDFLYDEYALKMAETAGFGLADTLYQRLSGIQAYQR